MGVNHLNGILMASATFGSMNAGGWLPALAGILLITRFGGRVSNILSRYGRDTNGYEGQFP